jgi:hypothetical protein
MTSHSVLSRGRAVEFRRVVGRAAAPLREGPLRAAVRFPDLGRPVVARRPAGPPPIGSPATTRPAMAAPDKSLRLG